MGFDQKIIVMNYNDRPLSTGSFRVRNRSKALHFSPKPTGKLPENQPKTLRFTPEEARKISQDAQRAGILSFKAPLTELERDRAAGKPRKQP